MDNTSHTYEVVVEQPNRYVIVVQAANKDAAKDAALMQFGRLWKRQELAPWDRGKPRVVSLTEFNRDYGSQGADERAKSNY